VEKRIDLVRNERKKMECHRGWKKLTVQQTPRRMIFIQADVVLLFEPGRAKVQREASLAPSMVKAIGLFRATP
jgi:flagellar motor protein MotB